MTFLSVSVRRWLVISAAAAALFLIFFYLFFPVARINTVIDQTLLAQGLRLSPGAGKTLVPGLSWRDTVLSGDRGPLLQIRQATIRPLPLAFLAGRPALQSRLTLPAGRVELVYGLRGASLLQLEADAVSLESLPFFQTVLGGRAGGVLKLNGAVRRTPTGASGEVRLEVRQLELSGIKLGGFALPDVSGLTSQGMVRVTNGAARLESFTLQGNGIYMRLSGDVPTGANAANVPLNLVLEIMPKPEFLESQKLVFLLLAKFMVSPGVYRIPVRGTLLKPEII